MSIRIPSLPEALSLDLANDYFVIDDGTTTQKIAGGNFLGGSTTRYTNIAVSGTPTAVGITPDWDIFGEYGYSLSITVNGITANTFILSFICNFWDNMSPVIETAANTITMYFITNDAILGHIIDMATIEVV